MCRILCLVAALAAVMHPATIHGIVLISEIEATPADTFLDEDGETPDWLELWNNSSVPASLNGYYLTDDSLVPAKWAFPQGVVLQANGYLVVFASDKDRAALGQPLHTNFKLTSAGETVQLRSGVGGAVLRQSVTCTDAAETTSCQRRTDGQYLPASPTPGSGFPVFVPEPVSPAAHWELLEGFPASHVVWTGSRLVAASPDGRIAVSADGAQWQEVFLAAPLVDLQWNGSVILGHGQNSLYLSTDGDTWQTIALPRSFTSVATDSVTICGVDGSATVWFATGPDFSWMSDGSLGSSMPAAVIGHVPGEGFWTAGRYGSANSPTGANWQRRSTIPSGTTPPSKVLTSGGKYYWITGTSIQKPGPVNNAGASGNTIQSFADSPFLRVMVIESSLFVSGRRVPGISANSVVWTGNRFVVVSASGQIARSRPLLQPQLSVSNSEAEFSLEWNDFFPGFRYVVQWSEDLLRWHDLTLPAATLSWRSGTTEQEQLLVASGSSAGRWFVPSDGRYDPLLPSGGSNPRTWVSPFLRDAAWTPVTGGVGYDLDTVTGYLALVGPGGNCLTAMTERTSVFVRYEFNVDFPGRVSRLRLRVKFDDGFEAWINGKRVALANAEPDGAWDVPSSAFHDDAEAVVFENYDIAAPWNVLQPGRNVLCLRGLNISAQSSDFLLHPELVANVSSGVPSGQKGYLRVRATE